MRNHYNINDEETQRVLNDFKQLDSHRKDKFIAYLYQLANLPVNATVHEQVFEVQDLIAGKA